MVVAVLAALVLSGCGDDGDIELAGGGAQGSGDIPTKLTCTNMDWAEEGETMTASDPTGANAALMEELEGPDSDEFHGRHALDDDLLADEPDNDSPTLIEIDDEARTVRATAFPTMASPAFDYEFAWEPGDGGYEISDIQSTDDQFDESTLRLNSPSTEGGYLAALPLMYWSDLRSDPTLSADIAVSTFEYADRDGLVMTWWDDDGDTSGEMLVCVER